MPFFLPLHFRSETTLSLGMNNSDMTKSNGENYLAENNPVVENSPSISEEVNSEPPVVEEFISVRKGNPLPSDRFVCNLSHVINQARQLQRHSYECSFGGDMVFDKITRCGLSCTYHYLCSNVLCPQQEELHSDFEKDSLNQLAVLGALSTGSGYSQEQEKFSCMNVKFMSSKKFSSCERISGKVVEACAKDTMIDAISEEKRLAQLRGDIDQEGYFCITVIVDGGWCKRSYGHGYNASSGISVIIGMITQKILFIGVRNKVCLRCKSVEDGHIEKKEHMCFKNWVGPSTGMESDAVVEGLQYLESAHKIRCTRLVGDGDSSTMAKVKERISYGSRVLKVECANHAIRRYSRALEKLQLNTIAYPGTKGVSVRKILKARMPRLIKGARAAIKTHAIPNHQQFTQESVNVLISDLRNSPYHVFGKHGNCGSFCNRKDSDPDESVFDQMSSSGMLRAIEDEIVRILISCSNTLIWNATNNPAEGFMSQLCKTSGGKRVDFSKGGSFGRRANIAVIAYQTPAQQWHKNVHSAIAKSSPRTPMRRFLESRQKRHVKRINRRKLFDTEKIARRRRKATFISREGDCNYGLHAQKPDVSSEVFRTLLENHMKSLQVVKVDDLEAVTRGQFSSERWRLERSKRISSSNFKEIVCRRQTTKCANLVKRIVYGGITSTAAMKYGCSQEGVALEEYKKQHPDVEVKTCGLFVDPENPFLSTSPDGLVGAHGLVEIKCPFTARFHKNLSEFFRQKNSVGLNILSNDSLDLPENHKYYYQIQGQLAITNRSWCDLFIWCPGDSRTVRVEKNVNFWQGIVPKLTSFYMDCVLPELIDPRATRNMPVREPSYILNGNSNKKKIVHNSSAPTVELPSEGAVAVSTTDLSVRHVATADLSSENSLPHSSTDLSAHYVATVDLSPEIALFRAPTDLPAQDAVILDLHSSNAFPLDVTSVAAPIGSSSGTSTLLTGKSKRLRKPRKVFDL